MFIRVEVWKRGKKEHLRLYNEQTQLSQLKNVVELRNLSHCFYANEVIINKEILVLPTIKRLSLWSSAM